MGFISAVLYVQVFDERNAKQLIFRRVKKRYTRPSCLLKHSSAELGRVLLRLFSEREARKCPPPPRANCVITSHDNILHSGCACQTVHIHLQSDIFMEHAEWADSNAPVPLMLIILESA